MHMPFEDFVSSPGKALKQIGKFIGLDFNTVANEVTSGELIAPGHSVGGNRARLVPKPLKLRQKSDPELPIHYRVVSKLVCGKVARKLGYD